MPLILPGNVASATASTGYDVANSCRFNRADSPTLLKAFGTPTNQDQWTFSIWCKRSGLGTTQNLCGCQSSGTKLTSLRFDTDNALNFYDYNGGYTGQIKTNRLFRDVSSWYHIVIVWDSGNATAGDRMKMYVNGVEETSFSADSNPTQDLDSDMNTSGENLDIGHTNDGNYFDGYLAEAVFVDGQALTPTSFGEFSEDSPTIWMPKDVSELTFGTNGGYYDFEASDNLGNDANGGTDLTEANLDATDQATDTPTNNFCTMNPLQAQANDLTFVEGNCKITNTDNTWRSSYGTFGPTSGKWYFEVNCQASSGYERFGIVDADAMNKQSADGRYDDVGYNSRGYANASEGSKNNNGGGTPWGDTWTAGDILACAYDLDNGKLYFSKNGTWQDSGDPTSGATGTGSAYDIDTGYFYIPALAHYGSGSSMEFNFGGSPAFTVSSANQDADGYGNFEYAVPSGYYALCTKNLAEYG